ncbi:hypothetical protein OG352_00690 [Streptomyces sp. NBC_01485]|uniref:hypothetical protein n=1 Tax=Streptomyces sp. NBC_01485 TaxID=2903884 RepID=UPI002E34E248|nr:hypothetical protein [Streptomyces sp. NBC_01485]
MHILAYTGQVPAARITMGAAGLTTDLPVVRLAERPAYVSTYAVSAPARESGSTAGDPAPGGPVFRVFGVDGKEPARIGGR